MESLKILLMNPQHIDEMIALFLINYQEEREKVPCLPDNLDILQVKHNLMSTLEKSQGWVAMIGNRMAGYLIGIPTGPLFGSDSGIYTPLYGHASVGEHRGEIEQGLFVEAASHWIKRGFFSIAITLFAHDKVLVDHWFRNGFGMRCVDAIRIAEPIAYNSKGIHVDELKETSLTEITSLHQHHNEYYRKSPIFMPNETEDALEDLRLWISKPTHHLFAAYLGNVAVGYIQIQDSAETIVSHHSTVMNITGAYVEPHYRGKQIGSILLNEVMNWLKNHGFKLCGVDYESINPLGFLFWNRYFEPYTYSLTRRIDDRIVKF